MLLKIVLRENTPYLTLSESAVIFGTGFTLMEPSQDARVAKSVTAARLVRISLTQETNWTLELALGGLVHKLKVIAALVVMLGLLGQGQAYLRSAVCFRHDEKCD